MPAGHLYVYSGLCLFLIGLFLFNHYGVVSSLHILDINPLWLANIFFYFVCFCSLLFPLLCIIFLVDTVPFVYFGFVACTSEIASKKIFAKTHDKNFSPLFALGLLF